MKRLFAITLLVALAAGPSVNWLCRQMCGAERPVAASNCHQSDDRTQIAVGSHDCGDHSSPVALVTKRAQADPELFITTCGRSAGTLDTTPIAPRLTDVTPIDSSPPLSAFLVPLRI